MSFEAATIHHVHELAGDDFALFKISADPAELDGTSDQPREMMAATSFAGICRS
jgi:hypothetical protein